MDLSKTLLVLSILLFVTSAAYVFLLRGELNLDVDLKGGTQISIESKEPVDVEKVESLLTKYDAKVRGARSISGHTTSIELDSTKNASEILYVLEKGGYNFTEYSIQSVGPAFGESFFKQAQLALILAFAFMSVVVFIIFRSPLPSFYIVLAAVADVIETLAVTQLLGVKLSLATFAALLLLIGYSVDTDILLTTRVLKSEGDVRKIIRGAMKTGLTMTGTSIAAVLAVLVFTPPSVLTQIAVVLSIGLAFDIVNTWVTNATLLRIYMERKAKLANTG